MTCENKMWRVKKPIVDFDGVSLYPSSMSRVWYPAGKPVKLSPEQIAFYSRVENLPPEGPSPSGEGSEGSEEKGETLFLQLRLRKGPNFKPRQFPLVSFKNENGTRVFTNFEGEDEKYLD